ncbi:MAG: hypothetical protein ACKO40_00560 [Planctomycetaceae bacterium]
MHRKRIVIVCIWLLAGLHAAAAAGPIEVLPPRPVGKGTAVVLHAPARDEADRASDPGDLLIHFHGAVDTIRGAMERAGTSATVVVVNQPGLSAAYAAPFRDDPKLFGALLAEPPRAGGGDDAPTPRWRRVTLSCFSAGYGAVREVLRDEHSAARVDAIVAADSIYAGLDETTPADGVRHIDPRDMAGFLAFARSAEAGEKVFVITHSAQPTPYASTTETANFLLAALGIAREPVATAADEGFPQTSRAGRGRFEVLGFAGASGPAHLFHLRSIDRWWQAAERRAEEPSGK